MKKKLFTLVISVIILLLTFQYYCKNVDQIHHFQIIKPQSRLVVQRNANNTGQIDIEGEFFLDQLKYIDTIEVKAELMESAQGASTSWQLLKKDDQSQNKKIIFSGSIILQAGGWYKILLAAKQSTHIVAQTSILRVGVGEVFVVCGQSNSASYGDKKNTPKDDRVSAITETSFAFAQDPQPNASGKGGSIWPFLGDMLAKRLNVPIAFANLGIGGSATREWLPGSDFYVKIQSMLKRLGPNGARAFLWHQGETDALQNTSTQKYFENMVSIIQESQKDAGWKIPWVVAKAAYYPSNTVEQIKNIQLGQELLWRQGIAFEGPNTDVVTGESVRYDQIHFNSYGMRIHAELWYKKLLELFFY